MSEEKKTGLGKGRSRLLYQISLMLVIVLVIIGVTIFLVLNGALCMEIEGPDLRQGIYDDRPAAACPDQRSALSKSNMET